MKTETYTVICWQETEMVWDQEPFAADLGQRPNFIPKRQVKAVVWSIGNELASAKEHVKRMQADEEKSHVEALVIQSDDPLNEARIELMR